MRPLNILLDLSGTLHIGDTPTPRAVASLTRLLDAFTRAAPRRCSLRFCSNTTKDSPTSLRVRLLRAGFKEQDVALPRLYTSLMAAAKAVKAHAQPSLLLLAKGSQELFEDTDSVRHFRPTADKLPASLGEAETSTLRACTTVVVGLAPELMRYEWLDEAYRILSGEYAREGAKGERKIIATHRGESQVEVCFKLRQTDAYRLVATHRSTLLLGGRAPINGSRRIHRCTGSRCSSGLVQHACVWQANERLLHRLLARYARRRGARRRAKHRRECCGA